MFTGIIAAVGKISRVESAKGGLGLDIDAGELGLSDLKVGDSVAVNGVCLTATGIDGSRFGFDVMLESLRRSSLGEIEAGSQVNLELALRADARLGGHIMQGHVDGVGTISSVVDEGFSRVVTVDADPSLLRYVRGAAAGPVLPARVKAIRAACGPVTGRGRGNRRSDRFGWAAAYWASRRSTRRRSGWLAARARTWGSFRGSKASACRLAFA